MTSRLLAENANAPDGHRRIDLVIDDSGVRWLKVSGCSVPTRVPHSWRDDNLQKFAAWLIGRSEPMHDTLVQLLKELGE